MEDGWANLVHDLTLDLRAMDHGQFVVVRLCAALDPTPYAQAAPGDGGTGTWYCELVSERYLPATGWPIDEWYLISAGWTPPINPDDNWSHTADDSTTAAQILVDGLRHGRMCPGWQPVNWHTARFPRPPDDQRDDPPAAPPPVQPGARGYRGRARDRSARTRAAADQRARGGTVVARSLVQ